jgi:hypothetical protein
MSDAKISREDAQAEIGGLLVAEICNDFGINFSKVYPPHILARGVGPEQSFIGLAIKRGHLVVRDPAVLAELPEVKAMVAAAAMDALANIAGPLWRAILATEECMDRVCDEPNEAGGCICGPKYDRIMEYAKSRIPADAKAALDAHVAAEVRKALEGAAKKLHMLWNADGTKGERRVVAECQAAILALIPAEPKSDAGADTSVLPTPQPGEVPASSTPAQLQPVALIAQEAPDA